MELTLNFVKKRHRNGRMKNTKQISHIWTNMFANSEQGIIILYACLLHWLYPSPNIKLADNRNNICQLYVIADQSRNKCQPFTNMWLSLSSGVPLFKTYVFDIFYAACLGGPCRNGGSCDETLDGFHCTCTELFSGSLCKGSVNLLF